jgi:biopolymer transport protein ExbB
MQWLINAYEAVRDFMELGGPVLTLIALNIFLMWIMIFERLYFFRSGHRANVTSALSTWEARSERKSWNAHQIREKLVSEVSIAARGSIPMIKTLVALCPLLGLLGTVTGMIEVFQVMAATGSSNARLMAGGVSKATIPTMAGMVGALSGVFAVLYLTRKADREAHFINDHLTMDH